MAAALTVSTLLVFIPLMAPPGWAGEEGGTGAVVRRLSRSVVEGGTAAGEHGISPPLAGRRMERRQSRERVMVPSGADQESRGVIRVPAAGGGVVRSRSGEGVEP